LSIDSTQQTATAQITVAANAATGTQSVSCTTLGEQASSTNGFTIAASTPVLTNVTPSAALQGQTLDIQVTGRFTTFTQGVTTASFGGGITINSVTVSSSTNAVVNITVNPTAIVGARAVTLTTGSQVANLPSGFNVQAGPAMVSGVTPNSGNQ